MRRLAGHPEFFSINTATLGYRQPLATTIEMCAARGIATIAPWRREVEDQDVVALARHIRDAGLRVGGYNRSTYFPQPDKASRAAAYCENVRALDHAAALGARCYVLVVGGLLPGSRDLDAARTQVRDGVARLMEKARAVGVPLALEPLHPMTTADRSCLNTLKQALDWCDELDPDNSGSLGVAVDVYHVWWDPALHEQIDRACRHRRVLGFHVSDWLVDTCDLVQDRGMMGDGVIDVKKIRGWLEAGGFRDAVEVEIFSAHNWWKRPEEEILDTCVARLSSVC